MTASATDNIKETFSLAHAVVDCSAYNCASKMLSLAFHTGILSKGEAADILGVQKSQIGKFADSTRNPLNKKQARALASHLISAEPQYAETLVPVEA